MKRALPLLCVFATCFGPFNTAGEATNFIAAQTSFVNAYSSVVQDGNGFDAIVKLKGRRTGPFCAAVVTGNPPLCAQTGATVDENGVVTREVR